MFLRKQLALYLERQVKSRGDDHSTRITLVALSRFVEWRRLLTVVKPATPHSLASKGIPDVVAVEIACAGPSADPTRPAAVFVRNHSRSVLACDLCGRDGNVPSGLRIRGVRDRHATNPALERDGASDGGLDGATVSIDRPRDLPQRFVIHDRDSIYSEGVDGTLAAMGLTVLKTPVRAPQANAFCERLVGTIRRECLDFMIPLNERHLRTVLDEWVHTTIAAARMRVWTGYS